MVFHAGEKNADTSDSININIAMARAGHHYGKNHAVRWCESMDTLVEAVTALLPTSDVLTERRPFGHLASCAELEWRSMLALRDACDQARPPIPFDCNAYSASADSRDCTVNSRACQVKATVFTTKDRFHFNVHRWCCGGDGGKSALQPYTVNDPVAYFILVGFHQRGQEAERLYGFRIISRAQALSMNLLADKVAGVLGKKNLTLEEGFPANPITDVQ